MIRCGFLSAAERKELVSLVRDGLAEHRLARRANAILLLDDGLSCERVATVLYLDDDTVRSWRKLYDERGIAGLEQFDAGGSSSRYSYCQSGSSGCLRSHSGRRLCTVGIASKLYAGGGEDVAHSNVQPSQGSLPATRP